MIPVIDIDDNGDITTLYTDQIDLYELGEIRNVKRASNIVFSFIVQVWQVIQIDTQKVIYEDKNRQACIDWEMENLGHGGKFDVFKGQGDKLC